jgi:branched-subunit amino acid transport protein
MSLLSYLLRLIPQLLFVGGRFPAAFDLYLRYLAYALVVSIISASLFLSGARFDAGAAPGRALSLVLAISVALGTRSTLAGMLVGTVVAMLLAWIGTPS